MEDLEEDNLVPDANGLLSFSRGNWSTLDSYIWSYSDSIIILDISHNNLKSIPPELGNLVLMRELDLRNNEICAIPVEISRCLQLRKLFAHNNLLANFPTSIQWCINLEEIHAPNNQITHLPHEICKLKALQILDLTNNKLIELPESICECNKLVQLGCEGNNCLDQIPETLRGNTPLVLWICRKIKDHKHELEQLADINDNLEDMARVADMEKMRLKDEIIKLETEKKRLQDERPANYLKMKKKLRTVHSKVCTIM